MVAQGHRVTPPDLCHPRQELVWPLDTCPLSATDTLSLRLRRWDCPLPQG